MLLAAYVFKPRRGKELKGSRRKNVSKVALVELA